MADIALLMRVKTEGGTFKRPKDAAEAAGFEEVVLRLRHQAAQGYLDIVDEMQNHMTAAGGTYAIVCRLTEDGEKVLAEHEG